LDKIGQKKQRTSLTIGKSDRNADLGHTKGNELKWKYQKLLLLVQMD